jgi:hypothetical protein
MRKNQRGSDKTGVYLHRLAGSDWRLFAFNVSVPPDLSIVVGENWGNLRATLEDLAIPFGPKDFVELPRATQEIVYDVTFWFDNLSGPAQFRIQLQSNTAVPFADGDANTVWPIFGKTAEGMSGHIPHIFHRATPDQPLVLAIQGQAKQGSAKMYGLGGLLVRVGPLIGNATDILVPPDRRRS